MAIKVSIVVPVFNEEKNIHNFISKILEVIEKEKAKYDFEIIFTDNCSKDKTIEEIKKFTNKKFVKLIALSKNFGRNNSQFAGLKNAQGDLIFMIDVDCQDPPELLSKFLREYENGFDIIYGKRNRIKESFMVYVLAKIFYRFTNLLADRDFTKDMGEFVLFTKAVRDAVVKIKSDKPFIRAEISAAGFKQKGVDYLREKRNFGKSKYNFLSLITYGISGFLSTSTFFLRFGSFLGALLLLFNIIYFFDFIKINQNKLFSINFSYIMFISISLAIYVARTHNNTLNRPNYIVNIKRCINVDKIID